MQIYMYFVFSCNYMLPVASYIAHVNSKCGILHHVHVHVYL